VRVPDRDKEDNVQIRYYMICSRFEALVASHLEPEAFGTYMAVGTKKLASGHVVFFEIDPAFATQTDYFRVGDIDQRCVPHADGTPKRSKYISVYRVMEYLPLSVFGALYLTTPDGRVLRLDEAPYHEPDNDAGTSLYQELCPLIPMVVSGLPPSRFAKAITDPANLVSVPRQFFADLRLDRDAQGRLARWLPYTDLLHIEDCVREIEQGVATKATKTVSRTPRTRGFFRTIRRGFFVGDQGGLKFYPFPTRDHLEIHHAKWWHSASAQ
jgi:hypothetical protein